MGYRVPVLEKFSWQEPVISILTEAQLPVSPNKGDRYIVQSNVSGFSADINGKTVNLAGKILWYAGENNPLNNSEFGWQADTPQDGWKVYVLAEKCDYHFDVTYDEDGNISSTAWTNKARTSGLILDGDIDSTSTHVDWILKDQDANALTFKVGSKDGATMMNYDTVTSEDGTKKKVITFEGTDIIIKGNLQVDGTKTEVQSTDLYVKDPKFTINKGGDSNSVRTAGLEFEADGNIVGSILTTDSGSNPGYDFSAPGSTLGFSIREDLSDENNDGHKLTEKAIILLSDIRNHENDNRFVIDQSLATNDNVEFVDLLLTGDAHVEGDTELDGDVVAHSDLTVDGSAAIANDTLKVQETPADGEFNLNLTGTANISSTLEIDDNNIKISKDTVEVQDATVFKDQEGNHVTVKEMFEAYNNKAKFDCALGCIVFDSDKITRVDCTPDNDPYPPKGNGGNTPPVQPAALTLAPAADRFDIADGLTFTFSEKVKDLDLSKITLNGTPVVDAALNDPDNTEITINDQLDDDTDYTLVFEAGAATAEATDVALTAITYTFHTPAASNNDQQEQTPEQDPEQGNGQENESESGENA